MIALKVRINDEEAITAGADNLAVLSASISSLHSARSALNSTPESQLFDCRVGGLVTRSPDVGNEYLDWIKRLDLKVGDVVTIEIVQVEHASPVISSRIRSYR